MMMFDFCHLKDLCTPRQKLNTDSTLIVEGDRVLILTSAN